MSAYPFWSLNFDLRSSIDDPVRDALTAVAKGEIGSPACSGIHPVVDYYLSDWRRLLRTTEREPYVGSPVRLFGDGESGRTTGLSIEFCQHDDEYANGGWLFSMWVLMLVAPPQQPHRTMIGYESLFKGDNEPPRLYYVDSSGFDIGEHRLPFDELRETLEAGWDDFGDYGKTG